MVAFGYTTVKSLQTVHFQSKVTAFLLDYIKKVDTKILEMKKNKKGPSSV